MGVVVPTGHRRILAIPEGTNFTIETGVFCAKYNVSSTEECDRIQVRVKSRLDPASFTRRIVASLAVDAPDSRKLQLVLREGEQHDVRQFVSDFLEYYKMLHDAALNILTSEVLKRLPAPALQIPVGLSGQRQVQIRFSENENITSVVEGFSNFYEISEVKYDASLRLSMYCAGFKLISFLQDVSLQIIRRARYGMAPGTFLV